MLDLDSDVYAPVIIAVVQSDVRVTSLLLSRTCIQYFKNEKKKTKFYISINSNFKLVLINQNLEF